jgi:hypothetical protein
LRAHEHKLKAQNAPSARVRIAPSRGQGRKKPTTTKAAVGLVILKFLNPLIFFSSFHSLIFLSVHSSLPCTPAHIQQGEKKDESEIAGLHFVAWGEKAKAEEVRVEVGQVEEERQQQSSEDVSQVHSNPLKPCVCYKSCKTRVR